MQRTNIITLALIAAFGFLGAVATLRAAGEPSQLHSRLRITLIDSTQAPDDVLNGSCGVVDHELSRIGIDVAWRVQRLRSDRRTATSAVTEGNSGITAREVTLVLLPDITAKMWAPDDTEQALGVALPRAALAYVFYGRLSDVARQAAVPLNVPLGLAVLHEIGHLLLSGGHTSLGIMRPMLPKQGVAGFQQFTASQEAELRNATTVPHLEPR
jgi:hypothetical protein